MNERRPAVRLVGSNGLTQRKASPKLGLACKSFERTNAQLRNDTGRALLRFFRISNENVTDARIGTSEKSSRASRPPVRLPVRPLEYYVYRKP